MRDIMRLAISCLCVAALSGGNVAAQDDLQMTEAGTPTVLDASDSGNSRAAAHAANSIEALGDINCNGLAYEIADAVMFSNYFVSGRAAFVSHVDRSIAASDINGDCIELGVADLVCLVKVIIGDALPYHNQIASVDARITIANGVVSVNKAMGAAWVVVKGNVTPRLLASVMEFKYAFDGQNTNIFVYSFEGNSFTGDFLRVDGEIVGTEFATANGQSVNAGVMPFIFELHQNYPNPFNQSTNIRIAISKLGIEWKLNIYNVAGQLVHGFSGWSRGYDIVKWDAANVSSGVYFYTLTVDGYSTTKKAVLLK